MERSSWRVLKDGLRAKSAMVISEHPSVTETAMGILREGGNAVDAAASEAAMVAGVCRPERRRSFAWWTAKVERFP